MTRDWLAEETDDPPCGPSARLANRSFRQTSPVSSVRQSERACRSQVSATAGVVKGKGLRKPPTETAYRMKLNAQQRTERLNLYGLVQSLSYVVRLNDIRTVQHLRARLAWVLRNPGDLAKPLRDEIKGLFVISGLWVRNIGDRHRTKRQILR